jgi:sporulation protein YlmC with PRC-barrel domain
MVKEDAMRYSGLMLKQFVARKILFAMCLAIALNGTRGALAQTNRTPLPLKARQLTGMKVENSDGQRVGTVRNLVLDMQTGELRYVVIGSGGFLGVHATLKLAPAEMMSAATAKRQTLAVNANTTQWNRAPAFKLSSLASLGEPGRALEISRAFKTPPNSASNAATNALSTTGRENGSNAPVPELKLGSDLIGMRVVNQKQEKIGEVLDLLVNFGEARPAFAVISSGRIFHREHQYAVPVRALGFSEKESKLTLNADATTLQQAPPFNQQVWAARETEDLNTIYRYSTPED